jgi:hypothetical protein
LCVTERPIVTLSMKLAKGGIWSQIRMPGTRVLIG